MIHTVPNICDLLICYNYIPLLADHCVDMSASEYEKWGVTRLHHHKDISSTQISVLKKGDVLFIKTDYINTGQSNIANLKNPIILLTGVSSQAVNESIAKNIVENPNIYKWFAVNPPFRHSKIVPLPIGFEELDRMGGTQDYLYKAVLRYGSEQKYDVMHLPYHTVSTNPERNSQVQIIKSMKVPWIHCTETKQLFGNYLQTLSKYRYTICLPGSGNDLHRIYEALIVGSIPVVDKDSKVIQWFEAHGIPHTKFDTRNIIGSLMNGFSDKHIELEHLNPLRVQCYKDMIEEARKECLEQLV